MDEAPSGIALARPRGFSESASDSRRPSLTLRIPRRGAPLAAYGTGLGTIVPCMTPCATPGLGFTRGRTESAPAQLDDDTSSSSMDDFTSTGSARSMSSVEETEGGFGPARLLRSRSGSGKSLRVSFAEELCEIIPHPTPVPEDHAVSYTPVVAPTTPRVTATTPIATSCCDPPLSPTLDSGSDGEAAGMSGDFAELVVESESHSVVLTTSAEMNAASTQHGQAPTLCIRVPHGSGNPFSKGPHTAPAQLGSALPRFVFSAEGDESQTPNVFAGLRPASFGRQPPPAPISARQESESSDDSSGGMRRMRLPGSPGKRKRPRAASLSLEDSCDADIEDTLEASGGLGDIDL